MEDVHVSCVLPQVPLSRSQNLISPQTRHEAHPSCCHSFRLWGRGQYISVIASLMAHSTHIKSMTAPYVMCVGISFKMWGKYLYATLRDTRSLKVTYSYSSTFPSMRNRQKRLVTHGLLSSRTLERHTLFQVRIFCSRQRSKTVLQFTTRPVIYK